MNIHSRHKASGFTLIEMMAVITIMVLLAAITVAGVGFVNDRKAKEKARIDIALLSKAIEEYQMDMGEYPGDDENTDVEGDVSDELYQALFLDGYNSMQDSSLPEVSIYLPELDPRNRKQLWVDIANESTPGTEALEIKDPWGRPYRYRKGDNAQNPDFDLWSTGKDGASDFLNPSMKIDANRDDIRNF